MKENAKTIRYRTTIHLNGIQTDSRTASTGPIVVVSSVPLIQGIGNNRRMDDVSGITTEKNIRSEVVNKPGSQ